MEFLFWGGKFSISIWFFSRACMAADCFGWASGEMRLSAYFSLCVSELARVFDTPGRGASILID